MTSSTPGTQAASVLIVEDDRALRHALAGAVGKAGYRVTAAGDGAVGARALQEGGVDVLLLDIGLPFVDGWRILAGLEGPAPSVIVISARGDEADKIRALDLGADDYLAKPFGADELLARIRAVLRRAKSPPGPDQMVRCGAVAVDLGRRTVFREGVEVRLSPTEYLLAAELAQHAGQVLDHRTLLRGVWGPGYAGERNYLRTFIQRLRLKLEDDPADPAVIVTVPGRGYRFGAAPSPIGETKGGRQENR